MNTSISEWLSDWRAAINSKKLRKLNLPLGKYLLKDCKLISVNTIE